MKTECIAFLNEKLPRAPDERRSLKGCYFNSMQLLEYHSRDINEQWADKAATREKRSVSHVREQFEETEKQGSR